MRILPLILSVFRQNFSMYQGDCEGGNETSPRRFRYNMCELRRQGALTDVTIKLDESHSFDAHKIVLASASGYFRALFTTKLETKFNCTLSYVPAKILLQLLEFMYMQELHLDENNAVDIFLAADYLAVDEASVLCSKYFKSSLHPENCIGLHRFAKLYNIKALERKAWEYIMQNFPDVLRYSSELLKLDEGNLASIISSDDLNAKSEDSVWELVLAWIRFDSTRSVHIVDLLKCVRLGLLNPQYFLDRVRDNELVINNEECRPIIIETLRLLFDLEVVDDGDIMGMALPIAISCPRLPQDIILAIGGWSGGSPTNWLEAYDIRADKWNVIEERDPSGPRAYHGCVIYGHDMYVIGGYNGFTYFNSCRCFNLVTCEWREVSPMNKCRCYVSVALLGSCIYAIGGYNGQRRQNSAERYDITNNQWSMIADMNSARSDADAAAIGNKIYVVGGFNGQECLSSVEVYDPTYDNWTYVEHMSARRSGVSCTVFRDKLYVFGGFNGMARMSSGERYDPQRNLWRPLPPMINVRSNFALTVLEERIFAVGGFNGVTTTSDVECYCPEMNEWSAISAMNLNRSALSIAVASRVPNVSYYAYKGRQEIMEERLERMSVIAQNEQQSGLFQRGRRQRNRIFTNSQIHNRRLFMID